MAVFILFILCKRFVTKLFLKKQFFNKKIFILNTGEILHKEKEIIMACYVNGVAPSFGNNKPDSIPSGNSQPTNLTIFPDFKKMKEEALKKFIETEQARIEEMEKALAEKAKQMKEELDLIREFPSMRQEIIKLYDEGNTDYVYNYEVMRMWNEIREQNKEFMREIHKGPSW